MLHGLLYEFRGAASTLPVTKHNTLERFVFLIWECPEERASLAGGDYDIAERSQFDTNAGAIPALVSQDHFCQPWSLAHGELIVELLHPRFTMKPVLRLKCHHRTTTTAELRCSYRSVH